MQTTDSGEFNFESTVPGLYFLRLKPSGLGWPGEQITGVVAVAIDQGALWDDVDVDLGMTSCGLWYVDRSKCPQSDLQIEGLSGQVLDTTGAAIADARILLFDPAETLIERLQTDGAGKFTSHHSLAGTYQLVVSKAGFTPLRRILHAETTSHPASHSALTVQLGVSGNCSVAALQ